jgi:hypothetical protein
LFTVAVNGCDEPVNTVLDVGLTITDTAGGGGVAPPDVPPPPHESIVASETRSANIISEPGGFRRNLEPNPPTIPSTEISSNANPLAPRAGTIAFGPNVEMVSVTVVAAPPLIEGGLKLHDAPAGKPDVQE